MFFVYVIKSRIKKYIYVGITENVERRVKEHNWGKQKSTKPYLPFDLIRQESFESRSAARFREKKLKSGFGKEWINLLLLRQHIQ